ncbi:MAG: protein-export chaperone SecB [Rhodospirillales bacterium]|jgi:preprotein translocase subunit SecB|nr:protein-export chaperone SecB [Rhodospirillales bacterium]
MSDDTTAATPEQDAQDAPVQPVTVDTQYIKDLSFEAPETPGIFALMQSEAPDIRINVDVRAGKLEENKFEVLLIINAECKVGDKKAFICELAYGGLFTLHVPEDTLKAVLLIECPRLLFPFARNIIADATRDGGFPPMMLSPIDFVALYRQGLEQEQERASDATEGEEAVIN